MGSLISFAIIIFVVYTVLKNKGANAKQVPGSNQVQTKQTVSGQASTKQVAVTHPVSRQTATNPAAVKKHSSAAYKVEKPTHVPRKEKISAVNNYMDDRENDWLANQLRDEHRAFKQASEMFGLKIEHAASCDAKYIRDFHHANCDAHQADTAKGR